MGIFSKKVNKEEAVTPTDQAPVVEKKETKEVKPKASKDVSTPKTSKNKKTFGKRKTVQPTGKQILVRPLITEKVTDLAEKNQYVFEVHPDVNKIEIKNEIKHLYDVDAIKVRVMHVGGKKVRFGRNTGTKKAWKKAIVCLKEGDKITVSKPA